MVQPVHNPYLYLVFFYAISHGSSRERLIEKAGQLASSEGISLPSFLMSPASSSSNSSREALSPLFGSRVSDLSDPPPISVEYYSQAHSRLLRILRAIVLLAKNTILTVIPSESIKVANVIYFQKAKHQRSEEFEQLNKNRYIHIAAANPTPGTPPLILLHGRGAYPTDYRFMYWKLRYLYGGDVYALKLEKSMRSTTEEVAKRVIPLLKELGYSKYHLCGHSMGGLVVHQIEWLLHQELSPSFSIEKIMTIATPFEGTDTAFLGGCFAYKVFSPGSTSLAETRERMRQTLDRADHAIRAEVEVPLDMIVLGGHTLPDSAYHYTYRGKKGHAGLLASERVTDFVLDFFQGRYQLHNGAFAEQSA